MKIRKISFLSTVLVFSLTVGTASAIAAPENSIKATPIVQKATTISSEDSNINLLTNFTSSTNALEIKDFKAYTAEEYKNKIKAVENNTTINQEEKTKKLKDMNENLKKLEADNGKGKFMILKGENDTDDDIVMSSKESVNESDKSLYSEIMVFSDESIKNK